MQVFDLLDTKTAETRLHLVVSPDLKAGIPRQLIVNKRRYLTARQQQYQHRTYLDIYVTLGSIPSQSVHKSTIPPTIFEPQLFLYSTDDIVHFI